VNIEVSEKAAVRPARAAQLVGTINSIPLNLLSSKSAQNSSAGVNIEVSEKAAVRPAKQLALIIR